jgi:phage terminase Nu1 subunit (DNA packaging protein)
MLIETDDIINSTEIAELFGVSQPAVSNWKKRHDDFPKPFHVVRGYGGVEYSLYLRHVIIAWYREHYSVDDIQTKIERLQNLKKELEK